MNLSSMSDDTFSSALVEGIVGMLRKHTSGPEQSPDVRALLREAAAGGWLDIVEAGFSDSPEVSLEDALLIGEVLGRHLAPFPLAVAAGFLKPVLAGVEPGPLRARIESWLEDGAVVVVPRPEIVVDDNNPHQGRYVLSGDVRIEDVDGTPRLYGHADRLTGGEAQVVVVSVGETLAAVPTDLRGVTLTSIPTVIPGFDAGRVHFDGVAVEEIYVGDANLSEAVHNASMTWSLALDAYAVGACREMVATAVPFLLTREQFGKPIGSFQAVQHLAADMLIAAETSYSCLLAAARSVADSPSAALPAVVASRLHCSAAAISACQTAIQLHGGIGFTWEMGLHFWYRAAQFAQNYLTEIPELRGFLVRCLGTSSVEAGRAAAT